MIAIVESGSTKSDWRIVHNDAEILQTNTAGFNPYHIGTAQIATEVRANAQLAALSHDIAEVYFYGAGCSTPTMNTIVAEALMQVFAKAKVLVNHDLLGAALGASQGHESIVCILGTGSNACYFDGKEVDNGRTSLGYILGDEAGGVWFGKRLLADHLHGMLPTEMHETLVAMGVDKEQVLQRIYREPRPNTYMAGFMPVLNKHRTNAYTQQLLQEGFAAFLSRYVCAFEQHATLTTHFVGSVAFHFTDELKQAASALGITVGNIVQHPVNGLVQYHLQRTA